MHRALWAGVLAMGMTQSSLSFGIVEILNLCRTLTLVLPYVVSAINEKLLYIFGACNIISIPIGEDLLPVLTYLLSN